MPAPDDEPASKIPSMDAAVDAEVMLLDRDGVINEPVLDALTGTPESPLHPGDVRLVHGAAGALAELKARGTKLVIVSNQPAAAKGTVSMTELEAVHRRTVELLAQAGVELDGWNYCFHHPDGVVPELSGPCDCRKPRPGLLLDALATVGAAPESAWMVGDADSDVVAGQSAGTRTALLTNPLTSHRREGNVRPDVTAADLAAFVELIAR